MLLIALAALLAASANPSGIDQACAPGNAPIVWDQLPTSGDMERAVSHRAEPAEVKTEMVCTLGPDGRPRRCIVTREEPPGFGFGNAALSVASKFRLATTTGESPEGRCVRIPMTWKFN